MNDVDCASVRVFIVEVKEETEARGQRRKKAIGAAKLACEAV